MAHFTRNLAAVSMGLAWHLLGSSAVAQQAAETPALLPKSHTVVAATTPPGDAKATPTTLHQFRVRARTPGRRLEIRSRHDVAIARCVGSCWLHLPNSEYKVLFFDALGQPHDFEFSVSGPGGIELEDADEETASTGMGFGIAGAGLALGGTVLMAMGITKVCLMSECEDAEASHVGGWMVLGGLGAAVVGAIMTPIGWAAWSRNRNPQIHLEPTDYRVAIVPSRDGAILGLTGRF